MSSATFSRPARPAGPADPAGPRAHRAPAPARAHALGLVSFASAVALAWGVLRRHDLDLTPREGLGHGLGIAGLACMVALLGYSARKRAGALRSAGPVRHWFHVHMILGIVGPIAILFHAGFEARSLNGAVALAAMLLVAGSGIVGRFVYTRVHLGLFGRRQTLREVTGRADASRRALEQALERAPGIRARVQGFESGALRGADTDVVTLLLLGPRSRRVQREARATLRAGGRDPVVESALREHLALVRRVAGFTFYERVLSLWHAVHLPLCVVLFVAAALHVFAVHRY